jgi:hypothetical protein
MTEQHEQRELPPSDAPRVMDGRTFAGMFGAALLGVAWAAYNYSSTGGERGEENLVPLVWTIFATPFALFIGWSLVRRAETWLAAFVCFCLYFFTPFVASRIESLFMTPEQASTTGHVTYFWLVIGLHLSSALAISVWRSLDRVMQRMPAADGQQPVPQPSSDHG